MSRGALALVVLAGCWRGDEAPTTTPKPAEKVETTVLCSEFGFKSLMRGVIMVNGRSAAPDFDTAQADAEKDEEEADGAGRTDMLRAARLHLSCATRYRAVPDGDPLRDTAYVNATACYENAMYAFVMAGKFEAEGRLALQKAIIEDPRLEPELSRILAAPPHDCAVRR